MNSTQTTFVRLRWSAIGIAVFLGLATCTIAGADDEKKGDSKSPAGEIQLPDVGIRMTPGLLKAISNRFANEMKGNLELDDQQTTDVENIITQHLGKLANDNAVQGRDAIEKLMETMILNDGRMPKDDAVKF